MQGLVQQTAQLSQFSGAAPRKCFQPTYTRHARLVVRAHAHQNAEMPGPNRRALLLSGLTVGSLFYAGHAQAFEWLGVDLARKVLRPDGEEQQALVALLDARGTLKELAALAATPLDSEERFRARALLPSMAKRLREVATAAPVIAQVIAGDRESTLTEKYGGTGQGNTVTDPVFEAIGMILTISGRTIKVEAQEDPSLSETGIAAITTFLSYVPQEKMDAAQQFRISRAQAA